MRTETVTIAGKNIVIRERLIKDIKDNLIPKLEPAWDALAASDINNLVDTLNDQFADIFPELEGINIEECYPSEIEEFLEAWINVNFSGIKKVIGWLPSLGTAALPKSG